MPDFAHFYPSNWRSWASLSSPQRGSLRKQRHKRDSLARSAFGFAKCNRWRAFLIARSARRAHLADSFALRPEALRGDPAPLRCELRFPSPCFLRSLSLSRGCRFSLFSATPCTPMLNFFARSGPKIEKIDSLCPGRGQARLARAGEGSI